MNSKIKKVFELFPQFEIFIRQLYYSNTTVYKKLKLSKPKTKVKYSVIPNLFDKIKNKINMLGIENGDILIVHSSMDKLYSLGVSSKNILDYLIEKVGDRGTLVLPVYPIINRNNLVDRQKYDVKKTVCSTGMIPNIFLRYSEVVRSEFPYNSLAAKGKKASEMMKNNLKSDLAHGPNSSWEYCINNHAKVLFLGVEAYHTATIVHAVEDLLDKEWPISDWYEEKQYIIKNENSEKIFTARIRKQYWSRFLTEHYTAKVFEDKLLLKRLKIEGIPIEYIPDSKKLIDFLINETKTGKLYLKIPKKYWK